MCERTIERWSPGERHLALLDLDLLPLAWEHKITVVDPPDVLAAGIDELEFQIVCRRIATHVKRELVVGRKVDSQGTTYAGIAGDARDIEIEAQGLPGATFDRSECRSDAIRGTGLPLRLIREPIVQAWQLRAERRYPYHHGKTQGIDQKRQP